MWPFTLRCKSNILSQRADSTYRCDRDRHHVGPHTCTTEVRQGRDEHGYPKYIFKVWKWVICVECGLVDETLTRTCKSCQDRA